jgi:hypothetical protein
MPRLFCTQVFGNSPARGWMGELAGSTLTHNSTTPARATLDVVHLAVDGAFERTEAVDGATLITSGAWWLDGSLLKLEPSSCYDSSVAEWRECQEVSQHGLLLTVGKGRLRWLRRTYSLARA